MVKMSEILQSIEESMKGFDPELNLKKGDIAVGQAIGHMWKAAAELEVASGLTAQEQSLRKNITSIWKNVQSVDNENKGYMKAIFSVAKKVYGRGSKLPDWANI